MPLSWHFAPQTSGFSNKMSENHLELDGGVNCNFAAMKDSVYADLKASREMEGQRVSWETARPQLSLGARFRKFFIGR